MKLNNNSKFDIDLKYGQLREKRVAKLLGGGEKQAILLLSMSIEESQVV